MKTNKDQRKKRGAGRPSLGIATKEQMIGFTCTRKDAKRIKDYAALLEIPMAQMIRKAIFEYMRTEEEK